MREYRGSSITRRVWADGSNWGTVGAAHAGHYVCKDWCVLLCYAFWSSGLVLYVQVQSGVEHGWVLLVCSGYCATFDFVQVRIVVPRVNSALHGMQCAWNDGGPSCQTIRMIGEYGHGCKKAIFKSIHCLCAM